MTSSLPQTPPAAHPARAARPQPALAPLGRGDWLVVAALVALATALRLWGLGTGTLWLDEGYSLLQSERSLRDIIALRSYDANPPFYFLLLHVWRSLLGPGELAAQSLSVVAGIAGVALVWRVTRLRFGATAALAAGLMVALSRFHVYYSQEIRGYALLFALVAAADLFFVRFEVSARRRDLCGFALAGFLAVMTHIFAGFMLAVHSLLARRRRAVLAAVAGIALAAIPMLLALVQHLTIFKPQGWIPVPDFAALVQALWVLGGCGRIALLTWGLALLGLAVHLAPRLPALLGRDDALPGWRAAAVPGLQLTLPLVVWLVSVLALPMLVERYLLIALLPLACLAGAGVAALRITSARVVLLAALAVLSVPPLLDQHAQLARTGLSREIADVLHRGYRPGDVVLYTSKFDYAPFVALHPSDMEEYLLPPLEGANASAVLSHYTSRRVRREVPERGEYRRLWLVRQSSDAPEDVVASDWFRALEPRLAWQHPSGLLLRFDLPP